MTGPSFDPSQAQAAITSQLSAPAQASEALAGGLLMESLRAIADAGPTYQKMLTERLAASSGEMQLAELVAVLAAVSMDRSDFAATDDEDTDKRFAAQDLSRRAGLLERQWKIKHVYPTWRARRDLTVAQAAILFGMNPRAIENWEKRAPGMLYTGDDGQRMVHVEAIRTTAEQDERRDEVSDRISEQLQGKLIGRQQILDAIDEQRRQG